MSSIYDDIAKITGKQLPEPTLEESAPAQEEQLDEAFDAKQAWYKEIDRAYFTAEALMSTIDTKRTMGLKGDPQRALMNLKIVTKVIEDAHREVIRRDIS